MGGRVAEEIFLGDVSSGASADIQQPPVAPGPWFAIGHERQARHGPVRRRLLDEFLRRDMAAPAVTARKRRRPSSGGLASRQQRLRQGQGNHRRAPRRDGKDHRPRCSNTRRSTASTSRTIIEHGRMLTPPPARFRRPPIDAQGAAPVNPRSRRRKTTADLPGLPRQRGVGLILKGGVAAMSDFLLVIPASESTCDASFFNRTCLHLSGAPFTTEIQIVDDGSPPAEQQALLLAVATGRFNQCTVPPPPAFLRITERRNHPDRLASRRRQLVARVCRCGRLHPGFRGAPGFFPGLEERAQRKIHAFLPRAFSCWDARSSGVLRHSADASSPRWSRIFQDSLYDSQCGLKVLPRAWFLRVNPLLQGRAFASISSFWSRCSTRSLHYRGGRSIGKISRAVRSAC